MSDTPRTFVQQTPAIPEWHDCEAKNRRGETLTALERLMLYNPIEADTLRERVAAVLRELER